MWMLRPRCWTPAAFPAKEIYRSDSLHMNGAGYAEWTKVLKPV